VEIVERDFPKHPAQTALWGLPVSLIMRALP